MTLRPLVPSDAEVMAGWAADREFCREAEWRTDRSLADYERFHRALIDSPPRDLVRLGAVEAGVLVGYVDLHGDEPEQRELGFVIGERERWGHGLGRLAGAAGLAFGFEQLGLHEIWAEALEANRRSVRILQRLGFDESGTGDVGEFLGEPTRYRQFAITRTDWLKRLGTTDQ